MANTTEPVSPELRIMTYNVHSCIGTDRRHDPGRIAEVIAACAPDVVALQELDVGRLRTGHTDQAAIIAQHLRMNGHFHPALELEEEKYGDAILSTFPTRLIKAGGLPSIGEPRGAIWVEIDCGGRSVQIVNTHLGLRRRERMAQAAVLLGPEWLGSEACHHGPTIFAGDLNAVPSSAVFAALGKHMSVAREVDGRLKPTFPSRFPMLRLDYIFTKGVRLVSAERIDMPLTRKASDHLPLMATLEIDG